MVTASATSFVDVKEKHTLMAMSYIIYIHCTSLITWASKTNKNNYTLFYIYNTVELERTGFPSKSKV